MCCSVQYFGASITHTHICVISWHKIVLFVACAAKYSSIFWCKRRTYTHCVISRHKIVLFDACAAKCSSIFWCKLFLYTFLWDFVTKNNHIRRSRRKIWLFLVTKSHKSVYRQHNSISIQNKLHFFVLIVQTGLLLLRQLYGPIFWKIEPSIFYGPFRSRVVITKEIH